MTLLDTDFPENDLSQLKILKLGRLKTTQNDRMTQKGTKKGSKTDVIL